MDYPQNFHPDLEQTLVLNFGGCTDKNEKKTKEANVEEKPEMKKQFVEGNGSEEMKTGIIINMTEKVVDNFKYKKILEKIELQKAR